MKFLGITQARSGSTRLPSKVLQRVDNHTLLEIHLERLKKSRLLSKVVLATTVDPNDDAIESIGSEVGVEVFRGSEDDVLDRFYKAWKCQNIAYPFVVRFTSDCPLIDPELVDRVLLEAERTNADYFSNTLGETFPDGQDIEVIKAEALERSWIEATKKYEREHLTQFILNHSNLKGIERFTVRGVDNDVNYKNIRLTVDEPADLKVIEILISKLGIDKSWEEYTEYYIKSKLDNINSNILRNEGLIKSKENE